MTYNYEIIRSNRKTVSLEITKDLEIRIRAPYRMSDRKIQAFAESKEDWIRKHLEIMSQRKADTSGRQPLSQDEIRRLADMALKVIPERVAYFADIIGVTYGRITIRHQKTRWGSCSQAGNLNFNCMLIATTPEILDYVVVHELCHRKQMNHSPQFWAEVEKVIPNYRELREELKSYSP